MPAIFSPTQGTRRHRQPLPEQSEPEPFFNNAAEKGAVESSHTPFFQPAIQTKPAEEKKLESIQEKPELGNAGQSIWRSPIFESAVPPEGFPVPDDTDTGIQRKGDEDEKEVGSDIQRQAASGSEMIANASVANRLNASKGGGNPLPDGTRDPMESAFGADFSGVRVHTGNEAAQLNKDLSAHAFTQGSDVYFGAGKFSPGTREGDKLLAHELTHVGQQGKGMVHRFASDEHQQIGDDATRGAQGEAQTVLLADDYRITFGEMVAMAGDFFESVNQMKTIAANIGQGAGTREEIEYVKVVKVHGRAAEEQRFSAAARQAADRRYYALAANNASHFVNPNTGDTARSTGDKANDRALGSTNNILSGINSVLVPPPSNAVGFYRQNHVRALAEAYIAGQSNLSIDGAMATEAFSNHYLTDSFAAGHLRTARGSISEYWNPKIPMFFYNFKGVLAERIANYINDHNWWGAFATVDLIQGKATSAINDALEAKGMPAFEFGDLVAGAIHDYDNTKGISATVNGAQVRLYGDSHLGEGDTRRVAVEAVQHSVAELRQVWQMGKNGTSVQDVISTITATGLLAAENYIPQVAQDDTLPEDQRSIKWDYGTASELLADRYFREGLKIFLHEKKGELATVGATLDAEYKREAFTESVINHMEGDEGINLIGEVLNWTPNTGGGVFGHNQDDNALDYANEVEKAGGFGGLSKGQRVKLIKDLISGVWVAGDEEEKIVKIFETAPANERPQIYEEIEGHPWNGNFIQGVWVSDDDLWNAIDDDDRLERLKNAINQGYHR